MTMTANLWRKAGRAPGPLPFFDVDAAGQPWTDLVNSPEGRDACGYIEAPEPSYDPATEILVWDFAAEDWRVEPTLPPIAVTGPVRIAKFWLFERFTEDQERRFAVLEFQARNLSPADLADPAKEPLFQLQRFLRRLDALTIVELDAAGTLAGFELLRLLGVFGDPEDLATADVVAELLRAPTGRELDLAA